MKFRLKLLTKSPLNVALSGKLDNIETFKEPVFGLQISKTIRDVTDEILNPRNTWGDKQKYDASLIKLANMFIENFKKFEANSSDKIRQQAQRFRLFLLW